MRKRWGRRTVVPLWWATALVVVGLAWPAWGETELGQRIGLGEELVALVTKASADPTFPDQPAGRQALDTFLARLQDALAREPGETVRLVARWARQGRHRQAGRRVLEEILGRARERLALLSDAGAPAAPAAGQPAQKELAEQAVRAIAQIDRFRAATPALPPPVPAFPLRPGPADLAAPVPAGASAPINVAVDGAIMHLCSPSARERLIALATAAFPGLGPVRVEVRPAARPAGEGGRSGLAGSAPGLDLELFLYDWTPPFTFMGFGPVAALAARFAFTGVPVDLLSDDRVPTPGEVFSDERLASFTVVLDLTALEKVSAAGDPTGRQAMTLIWPGQSCSLAVDDERTARGVEKDLADELGLGFRGMGESGPPGTVTVGNAGDDLALLVTGRTVQGQAFQVLGLLEPGQGQPAFAAAVLLLDGRRPGFPLSLVWPAVPSNVTAAACRAFRKLLVFYPWLEDLWCCTTPEGRRLLVLAGRGWRPGDQKPEAAEPAR
ncbi:MAG: hypothetical protein OZSIB_3937 [Candidatus Ozemobacter sibiricus]|jgi:hypothetical protein|uniref:Uncharacterized protein n=1 Tax=Candidatus Ozemobacter sibiricus TaxID=2268124 RepID=A0A367ZNU6_9BACT|nr:MAG: hypothetical protein OZSIB_3937 [Candidatus Ozemobacter sibiricus]